MNTLPAWTLLTLRRRAWKWNSSESWSYKPHKAKRCSHWVSSYKNSNVHSVFIKEWRLSAGDVCLDPPNITVTTLYRCHRFTAFSRINKVQLWWDYCICVCLVDFPWMFFTLVSLCLILVLLPPSVLMSSTTSSNSVERTSTWPTQRHGRHRHDQQLWTNSYLRSPPHTGHLTDVSVPSIQNQVWVSHTLQECPGGNESPSVDRYLETRVLAGLLDGDLSDWSVWG